MCVVNKCFCVTSTQKTLGGDIYVYVFNFGKLGMVLFFLYFINLICELKFFGTKKNLIEFPLSKPIIVNPANLSFRGTVVFLRKRAPPKWHSSHILHKDCSHNIQLDVAIENEHQKHDDTHWLESSLASFRPLNIYFL